MRPSSFCCICTNKCVNETFSFLLSLSIHHENEKIYIMSDTESKNIIENNTPKLKLNIIWFIELDEYSNKNRDDMLKENKWTDFQMKKALIIEKVLQNEIDTFFMDTDIIILNPIDDINKEKDLGVSPAYINKSDMEKVGYYNGGMIWIKNKTIPQKWIKYSETSRYHDQAAIDDLVKEYDYFELGENHNFQSWRFRLSEDKKLHKYFKITDDIYYKDKKLISIHTHFLQTGLHKDFNQFIIDQIVKAKKYKEILCIFRILNNGKWLIHLPKQPNKGIFNHNNDSYRELLKLYKEDLDIIEHQSGHIWLYPSVILYDRPTLEWINNEVLQANLLLLGNGDINKEGLELQNKGFNIQPWIFWPRNPKLYEKILAKEVLEDNKVRNIESIFIGNYENPVQEKYRIGEDWKDVISEFHITRGTEHKFTAEEYIMKLRDSKYGLCLRGYGSKCHREVECMGMGCVPIITENVSIKSYINPPIENVHYIYVKNPEELKEKISKISEKKWKIMSDNCIEWYNINIHSKNSWKLTIENIFYNKMDEVLESNKELELNKNQETKEELNNNDYELIKLGTNYGGWYIPKQNLLNENSIIYSAGVGEDISFDLKISEMYNANIILIDPTERSKIHIDEITNFYNEEDYKFKSENVQDNYKKYIKNIKPNINKFKYIPNALWKTNDEEIKFYKQDNKNNVSQTLIDNYYTDEYDIVKTITIDKIMNHFNHKKIDLLKLDIEGAENEVLYDMFLKKIFPTYLCIEFDLFIRKRDKIEFTKILKTIEENNYKLLKNDNYNILFLHNPVQI